MKIYGGMEVQFYAFLILALDAGKVNSSRNLY